MANKIMMTPEMMRQRSAQYNKESENFRNLSSETAAQHSKYLEESSTREEGLRKNRDTNDSSLQDMRRVRSEYQEQKNKRSADFRRNIERTLESLNSMQGIHNQFLNDSSARMQTFNGRSEATGMSIQQMVASAGQLAVEWAGNASQAFASTFAEIKADRDKDRAHIDEANELERQLNSKFDNEFGALEKDIKSVQDFITQLEAKENEVSQYYEENFGQVEKSYSNILNFIDGVTSLETKVRSNYDQVFTNMKNSLEKAGLSTKGVADQLSSDAQTMEMADAQMGTSWKA